MHTNTLGTSLRLIGFSLTPLLTYSTSYSEVYPHTDPANKEHWELRTDMSDEFERGPLDKSKWQICGKDGVYWGTNEYRQGFTGRGYPTGKAQGDYGTGWEFSPNNVRVEGGMLKITTKYEPDYPWVNNPEGYNFEYTTGGVWSKATFTQGYMEIRCKLPNVLTTGAFWTTGDGAELDVFEAVGTGNRKNKLWSSIHDWKFHEEPNNVWTETKDISPTYDFGDGFHTYAAEWDEDGVRIYIDGEPQYNVSRVKVENGDYLSPPNIPSTRWPLNQGQHVWADSEIFPWWGVPGATVSPSDYEIEYIRVWQKAPPIGSSNVDTTNDS